MHNLLNIPSKINPYTLIFISDLDEIENYIDQENTITIIDSNVNKLYPSLNRANNIILECNENLKTLRGITSLVNTLSDLNINIKTRLVVIGGGILQDLVGFCASIYARGIEYILIPTTLLSQTDSCIGGKTSINLDSKKNLLGTFYPPSNIVICTKFLNTLSPLDYISGLGEIYKFYLLQNKITQFNPNSYVDPMILEGLKYKINILTKDEFDQGERKFLNFGHTFGHALESISNHKIPHGIAVILGSMIAIRLSIEMGYNVPHYEIGLKKGINLIHSSKVKLTPEWFDLAPLLNIIKSDKKSVGKLTMVLLEDKPFLKDIENINILTKILKSTYESI